MPGRHTLLRLGDELSKLARPRHQLLAAAIADRIGVQSEEGVAYAVDRLAGLPFHLRLGVDTLALALATAGPERALDALGTMPIPLVGMYPKLVRSLVLFAADRLLPLILMGLAAPWLWAAEGDGDAEKTLVPGFW